MTVTDGVEDHSVEVALFSRLICFGNQWCDGSGDARCKCDLYENQRVVGHSRVKEGEAHPVFSQPGAQIFPAVNRMD